MNISDNLKIKMKFTEIILIMVCILIGSNLFAAPTISGVSGTLTHGQIITLNGSSFGSKTNVAPVAFDNLSQAQTGQRPTTTATVGNWTNVGDLSSVSDTVVRHYKGTKSAYCNMNSEKSARFQGGTDSSTWFVQYWFYLGSNWVWNSNINNSLGNVKIFRMWSTGSDQNNFVMSLHYANEAMASCELTDANHNWSSVVSGYNWIAQIYGRSVGWVDPSYLGWKSFPTEWTKQTWHNIQFEYKDSTLNGADGVIRMWFDGKLVLNRSDLRTRTSSYSSYKRPNTVGFYNSHSLNGSNADFYITDAYIDNTWSRVEIGNANTYAACTHREIQPPTVWNTNSISFTLNQGSFEDGSIAYIYVVDYDGIVNSNGYPISFGSGAITDPQDTIPPASPTGISITPIQ